MPVHKMVVGNRSYGVQVFGDAWTGGCQASCYLNEDDCDPIEAVGGTVETALECMRKIIEAASTRRI